MAALDRIRSRSISWSRAASSSCAARPYYEADPELGNVLRVLVADPDGDFELVVTESLWDGKILPGQAVGCDYLIRLS